MANEIAGYADLVVPEGTRLLHIGPHKTGTTSLQAALYNARPELLRQGVRHAGITRNPASAVRAVTGKPSPTDPTRPPSIRYWQDLVREIRRAAEPRVVVSSEFFSWATPDVVRRIADDLDPARLRIVVTLRPVARILPSQWQQNVQAGAPNAYEDWLKAIFVRRKGAAYEAFWQLHRHDRLVERWAAVLGTDRLSVVVVDERDHGMLLRVFEGFLGLEPETLAVDPDLSNRSMTLAEAEAVRAFNRATRELGVTRAVHAKTMRFGAATHMKLRKPGPDEARIDTPQWALDAAREVDLEMVPSIAASGVRVIGSLEALTAAYSSKRPEGLSDEILVTPEVAARMATGVLLASGLVRDGHASVEPAEVARVPTQQLAMVLFRRGVAWPMVRVRRWRQARAGSSKGGAKAG